MSRRSERPAGLPVINDRAAGIDIGSRFHVVGVPPELCAEAVQTFEGRNVVFVKTGKGFQATQVVIGERSGGRIEIMSGLPASAIVATKGAFLLKAELGKGEAEH